MSSERRPILQAVDISKSYAGVHALKSVSFDLLPGEVHALIGENGAGKSTLIKVITGAVTPDSGTLAIDGHTVQHNSPATAVRWALPLSISSHRSFPISPSRRTSRFRSKRGGVWRKVDWKARRARARDLLARTACEIRPDRFVATLSMPEQQIVEIAKAIGADAKVLILDEPTSSLTQPEVEALFRIIATLRGEGVGIVYISHRLEEIAPIADRVTVLRDGQSIATRPCARSTAPS